MLIANPIYDAVFKYMMDDNRVAKLLLSAIIGEEIVKLELRPTELKLYKESLTVYHIDFVAKIRYADKSEKLVIMEVQKAKFPTDIMRFRKYLGNQYINPNNIKQFQEEAEPYGTPLPIISIYILGKKLECAKAPVIKVQREYIDVTTGEVIKAREEFIESLTHDSFIIQVEFLKHNRKTELLRILSIFDQSNRHSDFHILNVKEEDFPVRFRHIIRRLQLAQVDEEVKNYMEAEDIYYDEYRERERKILLQSEKIEKQDIKIEKQDIKIEKQDIKIEKQDIKIEKLDQTIKKSAQAMLLAKINIKKIAEITGLSKKEIINLK